ncbi:MAG: hypothetical protein R3C10_17145 [Pirellulales bacterium]|nr:hypothetical protein [Planctomycetales bacterium]
MSVGPSSGPAASAAGSPLAQAKGNDVERSQQTAAAKARQLKASEAAENAAGIGETDTDDDRANDRDADGRRIFEVDEPTDNVGASDSEALAHEPPLSRDASGDRGGELDVSG